MYSKTLVAIDESDLSRQALQQAIELARTLAAGVRVVHVIDMSWLPIGPEIAIDTTALSAARHGAGESSSPRRAKPPGWQTLSWKPT